MPNGTTKMILGLRNRSKQKKRIPKNKVTQISPPLKHDNDVVVNQKRTRDAVDMSRGGKSSKTMNSVLRRK